MEPAEFEAAERAIAPYIKATELRCSKSLSALCGGRVYLKLENTQVTGSFKARGAFNKLLSLSKEEQSRGVMTVSTGNHGLAVAHALSVLHMEGAVVVPENVPQEKLSRLRECEAEVIVKGAGFGGAERAARELCRKRGRTYISAYNNPKVIAGQGTIGLELMRELPAPDFVFVTVGGGGLISGVGACLKQAGLQAEVIGCLPENSPAMYESIKAGRIVETKDLPTLSDGSAGPVEPGSITFDYCRKFVDQWLLVSESEIEEAMRVVYLNDNILIEGAAGVAVAALLKKGNALAGKSAVVVVCGGNVDRRRFKWACEGGA
jgi:threonine dehydratase